MPDRIHAGTVTDTECRVTIISTENGHVRLDTCGAIVFLTPDSTTRLIIRLRHARERAREQLAETELADPAALIAAVKADLESKGLWQVPDAIDIEQPARPAYPCCVHCEDCGEEHEDPCIEGCDSA